MSRYGPRIAALERRAERDRRAIEDGAAEPEAATRYLREGVGPAIWLYVEGRTGGRMAAFSAAEMTALESAMNDWLACYARCHGVDLDPAFTVREAAELLLETRNVYDVARLLTTVPPRDGGTRS